MTLLMQLALKVFREKSLNIKKKPKATTLDFSCQEMNPEYLVITYAQSYYTMDSPSWQQLIAMKGGMPMRKKLIAPKDKRYIFRP